MVGYNSEGELGVMLFFLHITRFLSVSHDLLLQEQDECLSEDHRISAQKLPYKGRVIGRLNYHLFIQITKNESSARSVWNVRV